MASGDTSTTASSIGDAGMGLQIAGVLGGAVGSYRKATLEKTGYDYQSRIAKSNAGLARQQADDALHRGATTENNVRLKTAQLKGNQVANLAARNIDLGEGSALEILTTTDFMGERDALMARDNANKEAWGYNVQAQNADSNADFLAWRGDNVRPGADAAATLLTGGGTVAASWYVMRNRTSGRYDPTAAG